MIVILKFGTFEENLFGSNVEQGSLKLAKLEIWMYDEARVNFG